jgi:hypothetical protein
LPASVTPDEFCEPGPWRFRAANAQTFQSLRRPSGYAQQLGQFFCWQRHATKITLHFIASILFQYRKLLRGLYALGDDPQLQCLAQLNDGVNDRQIVCVIKDVANKTSIYL